MQFTTILKPFDIDIWNAPDNQTVENARFTVKWTAELETRDWGIKSVIAYATSIEGTYDLVIYDPKTGDDLDRNEVVFDISEFGGLEDVEFHIKFDEWTQLTVTGLDIDLTAKTVEVS